MAEPIPTDVDTVASAPARPAQPHSRTRIQRHPERAVPEHAEEILRAGRVAHVAFAVDGQPFVLPLLYHYEDGRLYLHGAPASRTIATLRAGAPVCVEVTLLDGLVASRMAKYHSANYRSVVVFGRAERVDDIQTKRAILERMTGRYFRGRTAGVDYKPARLGDLRGVDLLSVAVEELSAKSRTGPPAGPTDAAPEAPGSRFVVLLPGVDA
jgi:nitroimidazol reductase NimA-like FMN-containing flavoprotein (pyridoxamine 5'-phosphate oxidase superfamily)